MDCVFRMGGRLWGEGAGLSEGLGRDGGEELCVCGCTPTGEETKKSHLIKFNTVQLPLLLLLERPQFVLHFNHIIITNE